MSEPFAITQGAGVARVTICRVAVRNALRPIDLRTLADLLYRLDRDDAVRVIVLTGDGRDAFCAGLDLKDPRGLAADMKSPAPTALGMVVRRASRLSKPLVGRINGACVGGGMGLLAICDVSVAGAHARFGFPEVRRGYFPFVAMAAWHERLPAHRFSHMALRGELVGAERALQMGMIHEVVQMSALDREIDALCGAIVAADGRLPGAVSRHFREDRAAQLDARLHAAERNLRAFSNSVNC